MITLSELLDKYIEWLKGKNYSNYTIKNNRFILIMFIRYLEDLQVVTSDKLSSGHLHAFQAHLAETHTKHGIPLKPRTINTRIGNIQCFLKFLAKRGHISYHLTEILEYVKEPKMLPKGIVKHADMRKLLTSIDISNPVGYRDRTIMEIMYSSGIRAGEVCNLTIRSVDIRNATLTVFGKGAKERVVPVGETALKFLTTYIKAVRPFLLTTNEKEALFLNSTGTSLKYHTLFKIIHKHCDKIKQDITCHTFRRSCTTELIRGGANIYHVKDMLGHENLETLKHYVKLGVEDLKKTLKKCHPREKDS